MFVGFPAIATIQVLAEGPEPPVLLDSVGSTEDFVVHGVPSILIFLLDISGVTVFEHQQKEMQLSAYALASQISLVSLDSIAAGWILSMAKLRKLFPMMPQRHLASPW